MSKLTREEVNAWIEALGSGKYKKGTGQLYNPRDNTYCCLGVLAVVKGRMICPRGYALVDKSGSEETSYHSFTEMLGSGSLVTSLYQTNDESEGFDGVIKIIKKELCGEAE